MARPRSEFLGSLGKLFAIFKMIADAVLEVGGSDDDIAKIDGNDALAKDIASIICGKAKVVSHENEKQQYEREEILLSAILTLRARTPLMELPCDSRLIIRAELAKAMRTLEYRERQIVRLRYGLIDGHPYTLEETGHVFRITRERVGQVEGRAICNLQRLACLNPILDEYKREVSQSESETADLEKIRNVIREPSDDMRSALVPSLGAFSVRVRKAFLRVGISTVGDLVSKSKKDLLQSGKFSTVMVDEIERRLENNYLKLSEDA